MSSTTEGKGKGKTTEIAPSEVQDQLRRQAKHRQRENAGGNPLGLVAPGQDLTTQIQLDRRAKRAQRDPKKQPFKQRFAEEFKSCLKGDILNHSWDQDTRKLVAAYSFSLTNGDGSKPASLNEEAASVVEYSFALVCFYTQPSEGRFSGQSQDWFEGTLAEVGKQVEQAKAARREAAARRSIPFATRHADAAKAHSLVTNLTGVALNTALSVLEHYAQIKRHELPDGTGRTKLAIERARGGIRAEFLEVDAEAITKGCDSAAEALKAVFQQVKDPAKESKPAVDIPKAKKPVVSVTPAIMAKPKGSNPPHPAPATNDAPHTELVAS